MPRRERRNLARAFAVGKWREASHQRAAERVMGAQVEDGL